MILWVFIALIVIFIVLPFIFHAVTIVLWAAIAGVFFGGLARLIIPGKQNIGLLATIACGWVGSLVGGVIGGGLWGFHHNHHHFATILIEIGVSAVAVLGWSGTHRKQAVTGPQHHRVIDI
jgi:uncharacterized membrane protein YeaQ/YmgE (transglycosylase-associated protein family)